MSTLQIKEGDSIIDCDPRMDGRRGVVTGFGREFVAVKWSTSNVITSIRRDRIHTKGIRSGYRLESAP